MSRFAELLRSHRIERGVSQEALADAAGISVSSVGSYERGLHSAHRETVNMLADALQLRGTAREEFESAARRSSRDAAEKIRAQASGNLPSPFTSFLGRESELGRTTNLLRRHRIVTLTGSGGIGKTRLAIEAASQLRSEYPDGLWFIDFSPTSDPSSVISRLALALEIPFASDSEEGVLLEHLARRTQLLIFDNCEHLVRPIADLAATIVRHTKTTTILATSRERLRITGEAVSRVPTLPVPSASLETLDVVRSYAAVALFIERAQTFMPDFALTDAGTEAVVAICSRLEGIPLAIELAAARLPSLGLLQLRDMLSDRFAALSIGPRDLAPRQQTLLATLTWSFDLLDRREQSMLKVLSSFPGSFTLLAAVAIYDPSKDEAEIVEIVSSLADKSFLTIEQGENDDARYVMLDSTREYVFPMRQADELETEAVRFAEWCASFADACDRKRFEMSDEAWADMVRLEFESIRLALDWALKDESRAIVAGRIVAGLRAYWILIGRNSELAQLARDLLARVNAAEFTSLTARLICCTFDSLSGAERVTRLLEARALLEGQEDPYDMMICTMYLAESLARDKPTESLVATEEAEALARALRLPRAILNVLEIRVEALSYAGRFEEAKDALFKLIERRESLGDVSAALRARVLVSRLETLAVNKLQ